MIWEHFISVVVAGSMEFTGQPPTGLFWFHRCLYIVCCAAFQCAWLVKVFSKSFFGVQPWGRRPSLVGCAIVIYITDRTVWCVCAGVVTILLCKLSFLWTDRSVIFYLPNLSEPCVRAMHVCADWRWALFIKLCAIKVRSDLYSEKQTNICMDWVSKYDIWNLHDSDVYVVCCTGQTRAVMYRLYTEYRTHSFTEPSSMAHSLIAVINYLIFVQGSAVPFLSTSYVSHV